MINLILGIVFVIAGAILVIYDDVSCPNPTIFDIIIRFLRGLMMIGAGFYFSALEVSQ